MKHRSCFKVIAPIFSVIDVPITSGITRSSYQQRPRSVTNTVAFWYWNNIYSLFPSPRLIVRVHGQFMLASG